MVSVFVELWVSAIETNDECGYQAYVNLDSYDSFLGKRDENDSETKCYKNLPVSLND